MIEDVILYVLIAWFALIFLTSIVLGWFTAYEDCPREVQGYSCRGKRCDHSAKAMKDAWKVRNSWKQ